MNDDAISRALGAGADPGSPDGVSIGDAIARGTRRRRRRVWAASGLAACVLAGAGFAVVATNDRPESVVGVSPSTDGMPTTVAPATPSSLVQTSSSTPAPRGNPPSTPSTSTTTTTPSTTTTLPLTTAPPTTVGAVPPPELPPPVECPATHELTAGNIQVATISAPPAAGDGFLAIRTDDMGATTALELWSASGQVATVTDTVPELEGEYWFCPTQPRPLGYDGEWIWFWSGGYPSCADCVVDRSRVFRADAATGEVVEAWTSDLGEDVLELVPDGAGGATIVTGPVPDRLEVAVVRITPGSPGERVWSWSVATTAVVSASLQESTGRVAFTATNPNPWAHWPQELHVAQIGQTENVVVGLSGQMMFPVVLGWQPGGNRLIVQDTWEDIRAFTIDVGSGEPSSTLTRLADHACWTASGMLAVAGWDTGYGEDEGTPGSIELIDTTSGAVAADFGLHTLGGQLACLSGDRVAFTAYPPGAYGSIGDDEKVLTIAGPGGAPIEAGRGPVWVVHRDGVA